MAGGVATRGPVMGHQTAEWRNVIGFARAGPRPVRPNRRSGLRCVRAAGPTKGAPTAHRVSAKWHPQERERSDAEGGTRDRVQRRDRFNSGTRERGSDSDRRRRAPFPSAPGEEHQSSGARDRSRRPRRCAARFTRARCGPGRTRTPTCANGMLAILREQPFTAVSEQGKTLSAADRESQSYVSSRNKRRTTGFVVFGV